jgi:hypothetical protein
VLPGKGEGGREGGWVGYRRGEAVTEKPKISLARSVRNKEHGISFMYNTCSYV